MSKLFGKKLKELRLEKGLSQKKLANILECSQSVLCDWENGKVEPTECNIIKLAFYFEITTDYLLGIEKEDGTRNNIINSFNNIKNSKIKF